MFFDVLVGQLREKNLHLMIQACIISRSTYYQTSVAEHITQDVAMVGLRDVVHYDVLHTSLARSTRDNLCHTLCVAVHRTIADHQSWLCLVFRHLVVHIHHLRNMLVPDRAMGRTDKV